MSDADRKAEASRREHRETTAAEVRTRLLDALERDLASQLVTSVAALTWDEADTIALTIRRMVEVARD